ncbi:GNAT family N-acetyltransferase [Leptolyngbya sp. FACHB-17]|uniref:GNAT family N-acetyltransferase n=1 Tax=unclassified Leptolyngbya TaxID=2650499 RepID=UPI0016809326|nr:GNAT family N-acetyltransferase [Leptolyngbya sp. FACHB-17]MBD2082607.1 GNAT family N-acetyltransferase [Leptolyngbya sp. FACHB-17]
MSGLLKKALGLFGDRPDSEVPENPSSEQNSSNLTSSETEQPEMLPSEQQSPASPSPKHNTQPADMTSENYSVKYQWVYNLTPTNCQEFEALTFPSLQKRWQTHQQRGNLGGVVAIVGGVMVGLAIVDLFPEGAEVLSLFVVPEYRQHGIGAQLLHYVETALRRLKCPQVQIRYRVSDLTNQALEAILNHQGWQAPKTDFLITKTTIEALKQAPWVYQYPLPPKFTVFPWLELTKAERGGILHRRSYPESLNPFHSDPRLEPINSLGLRYQGEVVGWTINHRVATDTIRYSTMYVEPQFQRLGRGFSLLTEAIKRQIESGIPYATTAVSSENLPMLRCTDRYYKPYATYLSESRSSYKVLD